MSQKSKINDIINIQIKKEKKKKKKNATDINDDDKMEFENQLLSNKKID